MSGFTVRVVGTYLVVIITYQFPIALAVGSPGTVVHLIV